MNTIDHFKEEYSQEQINAYYQAWANAQQGTRDRQIAWNAYCDARDGLKQGTSQSRLLLRDSFIN